MTINNENIKRNPVTKMNITGVTAIVRLTILNVCPDVLANHSTPKKSNITKGESSTQVNETKVKNNKMIPSDIA